MESGAGRQEAEDWSQVFARGLDHLHKSFGS